MLKSIANLIVKAMTKNGLGEERHRELMVGANQQGRKSELASEFCIENKFVSRLQRLPPLQVLSVPKGEWAN